MTSAMTRTSRIHSANSRKGSDWWPSENPFSGLGCTSILLPSAPAATAARAMAGARARNSRARARVVPVPAEAPDPISFPPSSKPKASPRARAYRVPWAELLTKVSAVDVLACPDCGGRLHVIASIADDVVARRILLHLGLDSRGPPVARSQAPLDFRVPGPSYDGADPVYAD